jgi:hypothetical protein
MVYGERSANYPVIASISGSMPRKKKGRGRKVQQGEGFGDFIRGAANVARKVNQFAKDNKLATKALDIVNATGARDRIAANPVGGLFLSGAEALKQRGYGKRKTRGYVRSM